MGGGRGGRGFSSRNANLAKRINTRMTAMTGSIFDLRRERRSLGAGVFGLSTERTYLRVHPVEVVGRFPRPIVSCQNLREGSLVASSGNLRFGGLTKDCLTGGLAGAGALVSETV